MKVNLSIKISRTIAMAEKKRKNFRQVGLLVLAVVFIPLGSALHDYGIFHGVSIMIFIAFIYSLIIDKRVNGKREK